jgi:hypothetical protein
VVERAHHVLRATILCALLLEIDLDELVAAIDVVEHVFQLV